MLIEIVGLVFEMVLGTLGHFLYEWSGHNKLIGFFFSKSESTWEHIKLGVTPILLWTIVELCTFNYNNLFFAKLASIITFSFSILVMYGTLTYFLKKNILFLDILIFYISLSISTIVSIKIISSANYGPFINLISFIGICFILYLYKKFNKNTPNWFIFKEP